MHSGSEETTILFPDISLFDLNDDDDFKDQPASTWAVAKIGTLQVKIEQYITNKQRARMRHFNIDIPTHHLISLANEAFGYNGWSSEMINFSITEYSQDIGGERESHSLQVECAVKITLKDGTYHEATGKGRAENLPSKSMAFGKAKKGATTDAIKKAIYGFKDIVLNHEQKLRVGFYDNQVTVF